MTFSSALSGKALYFVKNQKENIGRVFEPANFVITEWVQQVKRGL